MATGRLTSFRARNTSTVTGRLTRFSAKNIPGSTTGRLTRFSAANTSANAGTTGRLTRFSAKGTSTTLQAALSAPAAVEPGDTITLNGGASVGADSLTLAQVSGPTVNLIRGGDTWAGPAPFVLPDPVDAPILAVFTLTAKAGASTSTMTVQVQVYPHTRWRLNGAGQLVPVVRVRPDPGAPPTARKVTFGSLQTNSVSNSASVLPAFRPAQGAAMQEWRWSTLQPDGPGTALNTSAVSAVQTKWQQFKDLGFTDKTIGMGLHYEPAWTFAQHPLGSATQDRIRFKAASDNTFGQVDGGDALDSVWSQVVRDWHEDFIDRMAVVYGGSFAEVDAFRITIGSRSELLYPEQPAGRYWVGASHVQNGGVYLADDQDPVPVQGWSPSTWSTAQKTQMVDYYHRSSVRRAVWYMNKLRSRGFTGRFLIVKPGRGMTVSAVASDIATNLPQSSILSRGVAWHLIASMLPADPKIMLWASSVGQAGPTDANRIPTAADLDLPVDSTTANSWGAFRWIWFLANRYGFQVGGENPGLGMGATAPFYSDTSSAGLMARAFAEIAPARVKGADRFDWAHGTNLGSDPNLLAAYANYIATVNG